MADLRQQLQAIDIPGEAAGEERSWRLVDAAFDELRSTAPGRIPIRYRLRWLGAVVLALVAGTAFALTPAGAQVREWVSNAVDDVGEPDARPALTHLPAPGSLLIQTEAGTSIVRDDGSTRALGDLDDASWSPHGLYVAAADGRQLKAITAGGDLRWSVTRGRISDPAWSPNEGFRVAYRSGAQLRVVWGDGTNDVGIGAAADVVPAWQPRTGRQNVLAYAGGDGQVRITDVDTGEVLGQSQSSGVPVGLDWTKDGSRLLVLYSDSMQVLNAAGREVQASGFGHGKSAVGGAFIPGTEAAAIVLRGRTSRSASSVVLAARRGDETTKRTIFTGSGRLVGPTVAPNGREVLVGWPRADQWLFIPTLYTNRIEAVDNIRRQFSEPGAAGFPRVAGWCCQAH